MFQSLIAWSFPRWFFRTRKILTIRSPWWSSLRRDGDYDGSTAGFWTYCSLSDYYWSLNYFFQYYCCVLLYKSKKIYFFIRLFIVKEFQYSESCNYSFLIPCLNPYYSILKDTKDTFCCEFVFSVKTPFIWYAGIYWGKKTSLW